ncbi:MAG TPA: Coq4 family protein [Haliangium sp.]|nr:Coq4 family protein [Haliangium sp.]
MKNLFRLSQGLISFVQVVRDPLRLDEVINIVSKLRDPVIYREVIEDFQGSAHGREALLRKTRLRAVDLQQLKILPAGTLGRVFADHLDANNLDPKDLPSLPAKDDFDYVEAHVYETHDIWHVLTGFDTDVPGELGLQAFSLAHFRTRVPLVLLAAGLLNTLFYRYDERHFRMDAIIAGWEKGKEARSLLGVPWDLYWNKPLAEVRREFNIQPYGPRSSSS